MKQILIFPRFIEIGGIMRAHTTVSIGTYLMEEGFSPYMPFYTPQSTTYEECRQIAQMLWDTYGTHCSGVVFQGGNDIDPCLYRQVNTHACGIQQYRDYVEYEFMKLCVLYDKPIFGICRGMQMMNVVCGGSLYQDLVHYEKGKHMDTPSGGVTENDMDEINLLEHRVLPEEGSLLRQLLGADPFIVNSYHHQGICELGEGLFVEAVSDDGVVEAIRSHNGRMYGVQWHPEFHFAREEYRTPLQYWLHQKL